MKCSTGRPMGVPFLCGEKYQRSGVSCRADTCQPHEGGSEHGGSFHSPGWPLLPRSARRPNLVTRGLCGDGGREVLNRQSEARNSK